MLVNQGKLASVLGDRTAKAFSKHLNIETIGELLEHFPRRYSKRGELTSIAELPLGEMVTIVGEVLSTNLKRLKGRSGSLLEVVVTDGTNQLTLAFFNQHWRQNELQRGARGLFSGKIGIFSGKLQLAHPDYELFATEIGEQDALAWAQLPIPIYPATQVISTWKIQKSIEIVLATLEPVAELLPAELLQKENLLGLEDAFRKIHQPKIDSDWQAARRSLKYHEAIFLQLQLEASRRKRLAQNSSKFQAGDLLGIFDKQLGFELTRGQLEVGEQISKDLASGHPMHRLLQGEVGSGKTLVALRAILTVAQSGSQSALLAPTEVLAAQHFESVCAALGEDLKKVLGVRLLTGQQSVGDKKAALLDMASGKCLLVIGTHALISEKVQFFDLGMIVVDEQHRFGVEQREALRLKGNTAPHVLTMTATPIPRTLAITVFGDLEVSTLTELPAGRQQISSHVVEVSKPALVSRVWQRVAEEVANGRQAFVVCPRIDEKLTEDDDEELLAGEAPPAAAVSVAKALGKNPALSGISIGLLHGKMSSEEKSAVMTAFAANEVQILVSTTVIEVGVNIPNATTMVILDADRFGIAQLHQLRGRVGRGKYAGICLMVTAAEQGTVAMERLAAVAGTIDGFKLSELDLEIRREGDVLGDSQSGGRSRLKLLSVIRDAELIISSKAIAQSIFELGITPAMQNALEYADAKALERG